jgi:hypothetical protein
LQAAEHESVKKATISPFPQYCNSRLAHPSRRPQHQPFFSLNHLIQHSHRPQRRHRLPRRGKTNQPGKTAVNPATNLTIQAICPQPSSPIPGSRTATNHHSSRPYQTPNHCNSRTICDKVEALFFIENSLGVILGNLATYLQQEFITKQPPGWTCQSEVRLLAPQLAKLLGFSPRADVLMERADGGCRLWIEFEISRADPVANHAKFATIQLFHSQAAVDVFLSMISPGVARGRRNLAANMIWVMRRIGMEAYQTVLLPHTSRQEIRRLNHLAPDALIQEALNVQAEIERVLTVCYSLGQTDTMNIHFVANLMEVMFNLEQWNQDLATKSGQALWGKRTVTYFACNPRSGQFAPSKSCAYVPVSDLTAPGSAVVGSIMTLPTYVQIDRTEPIFDGGRAVDHLTRNLAMRRVPATEQPGLLRQFEEWLSRHSDSINVHPNGPIFLIPPSWA